MKKKKELLITLAGAAVLGGIIGAMSGCSNSYRVRTDPEIIGSFYGRKRQLPCMLRLRQQIVCG